MAKCVNNHMMPIIIEYYEVSGTMDEPGVILLKTLPQIS